ncbi:hypothetical protein AGMMS49949_05140 [Alphaproteobacteria bacterium]|nr:hypothetical protein AGMMS49949_05140 [Alphaproteobacteria bacterium]GHT00445.1 hypothetical protein AGMMS50296_8740 [Alphaproteobacteria bacterium]
MQRAIDTKNKIPINFEEVQKFFAIDESDAPGDLRQYEIRHCPFCGETLPDLKDAYWQEMRKSYPNLYSTKDKVLTIYDDVIPKEFRSGSWWRNRKL